MVHSSRSPDMLKFTKRHHAGIWLETLIYWIMMCGAWLLMFVPVIFVVWVAFFDNEIITFPPTGYTLRWFGNVMQEDQFVSGFLTSVQVSLFSMVAGLAVGIPASLVIVRSKFPGRGAINTLLMSPLIVPGIVAGTSLYIFFVQIEAATGVRIITTVPGFIIAHVVITIPWTVRLVSANVAGINRSVEEAAMSLGANPFATFWWITLPLLRPGIVAGGIFGFIISFTDLEMSLFLVGPGRTTLQIAMLQYLEWKFDPTIAAASVLQMALIGLALLCANRFVRLTSVV